LYSTANRPSFKVIPEMRDFVSHREHRARRDVVPKYTKIEDRR
jgi:hypothetical protein